MSTDSFPKFPSWNGSYYTTRRRLNLNLHSGTERRLVLYTNFRPTLYTRYLLEKTLFGELSRREKELYYEIYQENSYEFLLIDYLREIKEKEGIVRKKLRRQIIRAYFLLTGYQIRERDFRSRQYKVESYVYVRPLRRAPKRDRRFKSPSAVGSKRLSRRVTPEPDSAPYVILEEKREVLRRVLASLNHEGSS